MTKFKSYLSLVKFSHTIFALPFALVGFSLGVQGSFDAPLFLILLLVLLCMVFARNTAMAFNRYVDRKIDELNPRTRIREIPSGVISPKNALLFILINAFLFIVTTWFINLLCFLLSPIALAIILGYSYTKRFTWMCHIILGLGLALAPVGAYIAVTGEFHIVPVIYGFAVLCWVAGFDIIYALQDIQFDKENRLESVPATVGLSNALRISSLLHILCGIFISAGCVLSAKYFPEAGWLQYVGLIIFLLLLVYQHTIVSSHDLSRVNRAFFTTNGVASVIFGVFAVSDLLWI